MFTQGVYSVCSGHVFTMRADVHNLQRELCLSMMPLGVISIKGSFNTMTYMCLQGL